MMKTHFGAGGGDGGGGGDGDGGDGDGDGGGGDGDGGGGGGGDGDGGGEVAGPRGPQSAQSVPIAPQLLYWEPGPPSSQSPSDAYDGYPGQSFVHCAAAGRARAAKSRASRTRSVRVGTADSAERIVRVRVVLRAGWCSPSKTGEAGAEEEHATLPRWPRKKNFGL